MCYAARMHSDAHPVTNPNRATPRSEPITVNLDSARKIFDAILVETDNGRPIKESVFDLLEVLGQRSCEPDDMYFIMTDDEPGVAHLLFDVLALVLQEPGDMLDSNVSLVLNSVLSHKRWRHRIHDHDSCFYLVCSFIFVTERVEPSSTHLANFYRVLLYSMAQDEWPIPGHRTIDATSLADGQRSVLQELCDAAFGAAWWQIVVPAPEVSCVFDVLLATRPRLLGFSLDAELLELPSLPDSTNSL